MNARLSRLREALLLPLLLVVGCNVSDSRDQAAPEPGTALLLPRIVADGGGDLPRTDSVQVILEVDNKPFKDTIIDWDKGSLTLRGIKYGSSWKLVARGFLNPTKTSRWIVWSGTDTGTMSEGTKSTTAEVVVTSSLSVPTSKLNGGNVPGSLVAGSSITIQADSAKSVAWSTDGNTPACNSSSTAKAAAVQFDTAKTDSVVLRYVACKDGSASPVDSVKFVVVARTADMVDAPKPIETVPDTMGVGNEFRLAPVTEGSKIAVTLDSSAPACGNNLPDTVTVRYDSTRGGTFVNVRAIACKDGKASQEWTRRVYMRRKDVLAAPSLVGNPVPTVLTSFRVAPPLGAMVTYTTDTSKTLACAGATPISDTATINVPNSAMGESLVVRAVSCKNGVPSAAVFRQAFYIPVPEPSILTKNSAAVVAGAMNVGDTIVFRAFAGTKVAFTTNDSTPRCASAKSETGLHVIEKGSVEKGLTLKAVSCKDAVGSSVKSVSITVEPEGTVLLKVEIPSGFDSANTAIVPQIAWDSSITLKIPDKTTLRWKLAVDTGKIDTSDWNKLGVPGTSDATGTKLVVPRSLLATIPGSDTLASVIAVAVLDSAGTIKHTVRLRWTILLPRVPTPDVSVVRTEGKIAFAWKRAGKTGYSASYKRGGGTDSAVTIRSGVADTVSLNATSGQKVSLRVVATDSATGRTVQKTVDTVALRPPPQPVFTAENTNKATGTVDVKLDKATLDDSAGVVFKVGFAKSGVVTCNDLVLKGTWTGALNAGEWTVRVCAMRDSIEKSTDVKSFTVVNDGPSSPDIPKELKLYARDSSSLTWKWSSVPGHRYQVYVKKGAITGLEGLVAQDTIEGNTFDLSNLKGGDSASIAVVALATDDSSRSNSLPNYSPVAFTKNPPPTPSFSARVEDDAQGKYRINLLRHDPSCVWEIGLRKTASSPGWKTIAPTSVLKNGDTSYVILSDSTPGSLWLGLRVTRDSIVKKDTATSVLVVKKTSLFTPKAPLGLDTLRTREKITWKWDGRPGYQYRVFWSETTGSLLTVSDTLNFATVSRKTLKTDEDSFFLDSGETYTNPYRFAVQTVYAPDSTKGPSPLASINSAAILLPPDSVRFMSSISICSTGICFYWEQDQDKKVPKYGIKVFASILQDTAYEVSKDICQNSICEDTVRISKRMRDSSDVTVSIVAIDEGGTSRPISGSIHLPRKRDAVAPNIRFWSRGRTWFAEAKFGNYDNPSPSQVVLTPVGASGGTSNPAARAIALDCSGYKCRVTGILKPKDTTKVEKYRLKYQFVWSGEGMEGDTSVTAILDSLNYIPPPPIPQGYVEVKAGKHYLTLNSLGTDSSNRPSGGHMVVQGYMNENISDHSGRWISLSVPNGTEYPLGLVAVRTFHTLGIDSSEDSKNEWLVKDTLQHPGLGGHDPWYHTIYVNGRSWMAEPYMRTDTAGNEWKMNWYTAMDWKTSFPIGNVNATPRKGICPDGWVVPTAAEFDAFFTELNPNYNGLTVGGMDMEAAFWKGKFNDGGLSSGWFWTSTVVDGQYVKVFSCSYKHIVYRYDQNMQPNGMMEGIHYGNNTILYCVKDSASTE